MFYPVIVILGLIAGLLIYIFASRSALPPEADTIIDQVLKGDLPEFVTGQTGYAMSSGLRIWYESILPEGSPKGAVLLIMGNGGSAFEWPPKFIRAFVGSGYQIVRYDHRGTGLSDRVENWSRKNPYTIADLAGDAVAVLDALEIPHVHLAGLSMGGLIAQEIAASFPDRVMSLTLLSTSGYIGDPDLPGLTSGYLLSSLMKGLPLLRYRILGGEKNLIKERLAKLAVMLGHEDLDIRETAQLVLYDLRKRRGVSIQAALQHQAAVTISGSRYDRLRSVNAPTLVIHGTADQLIPVAHGKRLVEIMPNAQGLWLDGVGHVFPYPHMDHVNEKILTHLNNR